MRPVPKALKSQLLNLLHQTFNENIWASKALQRCFKTQKRLGSRDRRFLAERLYEIVRHFRKLLWTVGEELSSFYTEAVLKKVIQSFEAQEHLKVCDNFAIEESFPDLLYKRVVQELGEKRAKSVLKALNRQADVYLRANTLKIDAFDLKKALEAEGVEVEPMLDLECGLKLKERKNVFLTKSFKKGFFEVQDGASQKISPFLQVEPKMRVLDACSGAGGKTLHLAALMKNKGRIVATDVHQKKQEELKKRLKRSGVDIVSIKRAESKVFKRLQNSIDRLLLDVPCSGLGVLKRKPDMKWKWTAKDFDELQEKQKNILCDYEKAVKPHGKMVYATCSILPSENQMQIQAFLAQKSHWKLEEEMIQWPDESGFDGFYAARCVRL